MSGRLSPPRPLCLPTRKNHSPMFLGKCLDKQISTPCKTREPDLTVRAGRTSDIRILLQFETNELRCSLNESSILRVGTIMSVPRFAVLSRKKTVKRRRARCVHGINPLSGVRSGHRTMVKTKPAPQGRAGFCLQLISGVVSPACRFRPEPAGSSSPARGCTRE